jgi:hypothetical protein
MSLRRKCEKRHIGFLTTIYGEGISQTVCSFALQILWQEPLHCIPQKLVRAVVVAMHSLLPRWVNHDKTHLEHNESALPPISDLGADIEF